MYEICPETPADEPEVEGLYDLCFAPGRTALSSYRLRDGVPRVAELCLVLRDAGGTTVAVLANTRFDGQAGFVAAVIVKVIRSLTPRFTGTAARLPLPDGPAAPLAYTEVQVTPSSHDATPEKSSDTVAPLTAVGPAFETTRVNVAF